MRGIWRPQGDRVCLAFPETLLSDTQCYTYDGPLRPGVRTPVRNADGDVGWATPL
ncbi:MAG TPA: hypothetical protein VGR19_03650 [Allosphingosinicella sp.]|nr:hypothetical protein [Allosphingosinicella sp.]